MQAIDLRKPIDDPIFALIYGGSGTGKTHLVGTIGELGRTLVIDVDKGSKTLRTAKRVKPFLDNITVTTFDKFQDLDHAYKVMQRNDPDEWSSVLQLSGPEAIKKPFEWVVWDSWSELQWNMMQQLRKNESLLSAGESLVFRKNLQIQHWGALTDLNKLCVEQLRDVKSVNQAFVMLETMSKDELSGIIFGGPAIHGKLVAEFPGYFDVVARTYTDLSGKYYATTKSKGKWPAKTRLGSGDDYLDPTAKKIFSFS